MTNTITMTGNSTGYGATSGNETFVLTGYDNTVLLAGANDAIAVAGGQFDAIDLNSTGFIGPAIDNINLGQSTFNTITASHDLYGSSVSIEGGAGPNQVSLANHGGTTWVSLGYTGNAATQVGLVPPNTVELNGDATNTIAFQGSGASYVTVGSAGDGLVGYSTKVAFSGMLNQLIGGDENFTVTDSTGADNIVDLGNGNNTISLTGHSDVIMLGTGNNLVDLDASHSRLIFGQGMAGSTDLVQEKGDGNSITAGDENVTIEGARASLGSVTLGDGNDVVNIGGGGGTGTFGTSVANTATDQVTLARGGTHLTFNGGDDSVVLKDTSGHGGYDKVTLNGTMLGTALTTSGVFDKVVLTQDANAAISEGALNGGMSVTIDGDSHGGMGNVTITGFATDDLARIHLNDLSPYTITSDSTPAGGVTLHFSQGSIDLIGVQSVPNNLFS